MVPVHGPKLRVFGLLVVVLHVLPDMQASIGRPSRVRHTHCSHLYCPFSLNSGNLQRTSAQNSITTDCIARPPCGSSPSCSSCATQAGGGTCPRRARDQHTIASSWELKLPASAAACEAASADDKSP
jgi:hypothetical protein